MMSSLSNKTMIKSLLLQIPSRACSKMVLGNRVPGFALLLFRSHEQNSLHECLDLHLGLLEFVAVGHVLFESGHVHLHAFEIVGFEVFEASKEFTYMKQKNVRPDTPLKNDKSVPVEFLFPLDPDAIICFARF